MQLPFEKHKKLLIYTELWKPIINAKGEVALIMGDKSLCGDFSAFLFDIYSLGPVNSSLICQ